jgi:hypothetical protein
MICTEGDASKRKEGSSDIMKRGKSRSKANKSIRKSRGDLLEKEIEDTKCMSARESRMLERDLSWQDMFDFSSSLMHLSRTFLKDDTQTGSLTRDLHTELTRKILLVFHLGNGH